MNQWDVRGSTQQQQVPKIVPYYCWFYSVDQPIWYSLIQNGMRVVYFCYKLVTRLRVQQLFNTKWFWYRYIMIKYLGESIIGSFRHTDHGIIWLLLCQHFEQYFSIYFAVRDVVDHFGSEYQLQYLVSNFLTTEVAWFHCLQCQSCL